MPLLTHGDRNLQVCFVNIKKTYVIRTGAVSTKTEARQLEDHNNQIKKTTLKQLLIDNHTFAGN